MSFEDKKQDPDKLSDVIIYTKSRQKSSQNSSSFSNSASKKSNSNSVNKVSNFSRNKKISEEENKNINVSKISKTFKNSVNSNMSMNSANKFNNKKLQNHSGTIKTARESKLFSNEFKEQQDDDDANDMNCRQMIKRFFEIDNKINYVQTVIYFISFATFIFYVVCTYSNKLFKYLNYIDYGVCPIYMIGHFINFLIAHQPLNYLMSGDSIIFFLIEILPLFSSLCSDFHLNWFFRIINFTRVMRVIKVVNLIDLFIGKEMSDVTAQIITIISNLIMLLLLLGGTIQIFDSGYVEDMLQITYEKLPRKNLLLRRHFHHYIYFSIVTLTTVGYGDIVPKEIMSKVMVMIIAIFMLFYVPQQIDKLLTLSNNQTIYERKKYIFTENVPFVVLIGDIKLESLKSFCQEYFHKDHGDKLRQIVILMNDPPSKGMEHFINYRENSKFITYLQGKYTEDEDLKRAGLLQSKSCIIFTDKKTTDPYSADYQSLILSLSIKKFFCYNIDKVKKTSFKICLQLNKQENCQHYFLALQDTYKKNLAPDILLVIESLKMNLLSKSCLTPGIISLISNLVISSGYRKLSQSNESEWLKEYTEGQQYEIYKYNGVRGELLFSNFEGIAQELYMKYHAILIALEIIYKGGNLIKLNPQSKETIINIIYSSLFSKTKNTSLNDEYDNNHDNEHDGDSSLDIYEHGSDDELESHNYNKIYNLNFKHLEINLYCISSDESIIGYIKKLDEKKDNRDKNEIALSRQNSYYDKISRSTKKVTLTRQKTRIRFESDGESDFSDYEVTTNSVRHLIDMEESAESYETEFLKDYYTVDDLSKYELNSNGISNQGLRDRNDIKNHIVICGMHPELIQFIMPLRSKNLPIKLLKWIVILTPNLPQEIHDTLSKFPKIIFIQGDPLNSENLMRANIMTAEIAVILGANSNVEYNENENYEIIGKENEEKTEEKKEDENNTNDNDDLMEDSRVLFIYKSIKKLNSSIQIITELLHTSNIELLLTSKSLKKLYNESNNMNPKNNSSQTQISDENDYKTNLSYDITPVYAAGEVYLPTVIDRITSQISYNSNLLTILNLILIGEKPPEKPADKKLAQLIELSGSNLYLIPSEQKNESFNDMFKRLLIKYGMISIALYRKNEQESFYYVYTNPKKTTLVRKNDMVFVLSSIENLGTYYEKNLFIINSEGKIIRNENEDEFSQTNEDNDSVDLINNESKENTEHNHSFSKSIKNVIDHQILAKNENQALKNAEKGKRMSLNNNINNKNILNLFEEKDKTGKKYKSVFSKNEIKRGKYFEIDNIQDRLDKGIEKLKMINDKCNNINKDVEKFVNEEISSEFSVYIANSLNNNMPEIK